MACWCVICDSFGNISLCYNQISLIISKRNFSWVFQCIMYCCLADQHFRLRFMVGSLKLERKNMDTIISNDDVIMCARCVNICSIHYVWERVHISLLLLLPLLYFLAYQIIHIICWVVIQEFLINVFVNWTIYMPQLMERKMFVNFNVQNFVLLKRF